MYKYYEHLKKLSKDPSTQPTSNWHIKSNNIAESVNITRLNVLCPVIVSSVYVAYIGHLLQILVGL